MKVLGNDGVLRIIATDSNTELWPSPSCPGQSTLIEVICYIIFFSLKYMTNIMKGAKIYSNNSQDILKSTNCAYTLAVNSSTFLSK